MGVQGWFAEQDRAAVVGGVNRDNKIHRHVRSGWKGPRAVVRGRRGKAQLKLTPPRLAEPLPLTLPSNDHAVPAGNTAENPLGSPFGPACGLTPEITH